MNPYIIFKKNQTTVIDGTQPLFSVLNKKIGKVSTASSDGYRVATSQTDVTNIISADKVTKKGNFFSSSPQTIVKESSKLLPLNQRSPPLIKVNDMTHADPGRLEHSLMLPADYCQAPLDATFEDSGAFNFRKESRSFLQINANVISPSSQLGGGGMSEFLSPKLQINANVKMYSSAEPEGEIHPCALMPEKSFNSNFNMINVQGGSRKLSRIINFAAV